MQYDVIIIGAGPGGIFSAYELSKLCPEKKIAVFEEGQPLEKRRCPIDGKTVKHCIGCPTCAIMNGFGGAGAFSAPVHARAAPTERGSAAGRSCAAPRHSRAPSSARPSR